MRCRYLFGVGAGAWAGACGGGGAGKYSGPFLPQAGTAAIAVTSKHSKKIL
jgi:hypothetical protein